MKNAGVFFEKCGYKFYNPEKKELVIDALYSLDVEELLLQELEIKHREEVGSEVFINDCNELFNNEKIIIKKSMMETESSSSEAEKSSSEVEGSSEVIHYNHFEGSSSEIECLYRTSVVSNETNEDSNLLFQTLFFGHNFDSASIYII
ncbi:hypothetical protein I862_00365 [endosymbiont of Acanthamoeba sp. UWC8]|uniref:hypothetical protein n=1 Tax=endosymbiont of Acanthamoeba sp. UWC8 TaxID=86106 RepID=UPI0004D11DBB|nr:hypothetical protein [endosymbiont of Acanthamoeba sp. UWC8]AIF80638.1 hypothetical protein I862_00365 [endosymbiont of Acanthamoeba sp. UWC8]